MEQSLNSAEHLWKSIYDQEQVASRMVEIASEKEDGITFQLPSFGTVKLVVTAASSVGDNYMSDTYYNTATLDDAVSYKAFVKVLPSNPLLRAGAQNFDVHNREIASYCHLHPLLRELRHRKGLTSRDIPVNVPQIYYTNLDTSEMGDGGSSSTVIVMEELSSQGYRMIDMCQGCSREEVMLTMSTMANFHALTHMLMREHRNADGSYSLPPSIEYVRHPVNLKDLLISIVSTTVPVLSQMMQHLGHDELAAWLEEETKNVSDVFALKDAAQCGPLVCICHGDVWSNNLLFRFNDADVADDVYLIDWQFLFLDNPGRDIYNFLTWSTSPELRKDHSREILDHYVDTFISALSKLGVNMEDEGLHHERIVEEINKKMLEGMFTGLAWLPYMLDQTMAAQIDKRAQEQDAASVAKESRGGDTFEAFLDSQKSLTLDIVLANELLCHRVISLVKEFQEILQQ